MSRSTKSAKTGFSILGFCVTISPHEQRFTGERHSIIPELYPVESLLGENAILNAKDEAQCFERAWAERNQATRACKSNPIRVRMHGNDSRLADAPSLSHLQVNAQLRMAQRKGGRCR